MARGQCSEWSEGTLWPEGSALSGVRALYGQRVVL